MSCATAPDDWPHDVVVVSLFECGAELEVEQIRPPQDCPRGHYRCEAYSVIYP